MSVLALHAGTSHVTAAVVDERGRVVATTDRAFARHSPRPGWVEHAPEEVWRATLGATREVLGAVDASELTALGVTGQRGTVLLWDRETLGPPRPAIAAQDRRTTEGGSPGTALRWLAEHEPHSWALVESGRYAVGTLDSYLVARMTRGTWHVTDVSNAAATTLLDLATGAWSEEQCALFGVPRDALPELVPSWGEVARTEPRAFLGLSLPVAGIVGDRQAELAGQACFDVDEAACALGDETSLVVNTGTTLRSPSGGLRPTAAWRPRAGELTYALEGALPPEAGDMPGISTLRVGGPGAADDARCQALADRVGSPVDRPEVVERTALGVALLACLGTGVWASTDELRDTWTPDRRFEPVSG